MLTQVFEMTDKSACKYWDCGWCYAPNYLKTNAINSTCVNPYECPISPLSEPVQYETPMTEIEALKAQIKVLEAKLSLLEEIEKHKSPAEEAYKRVYGNYPTGEYSWIVFKKGYKSAQEDYKVGKFQPTPQERGEQVHKEMEELITKIHDGYEVVEYQSTDTEMLEFLLNQFQAHNLKMNGESDWVFMNSGFPMSRAKGRSARDAVITAMGAK